MTVTRLQLGEPGESTGLASKSMAEQGQLKSSCITTEPSLGQGRTQERSSPELCRIGRQLGRSEKSQEAQPVRGPSPQQCLLLPRSSEKALKDLACFSFPKRGFYPPPTPSPYTGESHEHPLPSWKEGFDLAFLQTDLPSQPQCEGRPDLPLARGLFLTDMSPFSRGKPCFYCDSLFILKLCLTYT